MLVRSLRHAIAFDPRCQATTDAICMRRPPRMSMLTACAYACSMPGRGRATLAYVMAVAPLRFGLDIALLGTRHFPLALGAATAYIVFTFVATHQLSSNYPAAQLPGAQLTMPTEEDATVST